MHASAQEHMKACVEMYLKKGRRYDIVDIGSRTAMNATSTDQRDLFAPYTASFTGVDVLAGPNVDVVMAKPYRIPLKSNSADVVISSQAFEHIPFFWVTFLEMCRVVKPGGLLFVIAPSRGHVHGSMDSWRFYPDAMRSLAAFGRVKLRENNTDFMKRQAGSRRLDYSRARGTNYWGDTTGVFVKPKRPSRAVPVIREVLVWWANRVGGIDHVPTPDPRPRRKSVQSRVRTLVAARDAAARGDEGQGH